MQDSSQLDDPPGAPKLSVENIAGAPSEITREDGGCWTAMERLLQSLRIPHGKLGIPPRGAPVNDYRYQQFPELAMIQDMTEQQRVLFLVQYQALKKDVVAGVLLAVLLGHFGAHRFYMGEIGLGVVYLLFCWTGIPTILGFIEAFLMSGRVREYNFAQASLIAAHIRATPSGLVTAAV